MRYLRKILHMILLLPLLPLLGVTTGVFPVHQNVFKVGTAGLSSEEEDMVEIKDLENFAPSLKSKTDSWNPMDLEGWARTIVTGKEFSISFKGKRNYGDPGNDYIAQMFLATGQDAQTKFKWTLPNGDTLAFNCTIDLKSPAGGDSTKIDALDFDLISDGLPVYTPAASSLGALTFVCVAGTSQGETKVTSISPSLTGGNHYMIKFNGSMPALDADLTAAGWEAYTLSADITCPIGTTVALTECNSGNLAKYGGSSIAVVHI